MKYPLASSTWDDKEYRAIDRVVKSGNFTMGSEVLEFEKRFADYVGSRYAVMVNSGSSANLAMISSLFFSKRAGLCRGDEVIVPAVSWSTTYAPLQQLGLRVKFVDIHAGTLNIDLHELKLAVTEATRVILAVNLLGNPNDFREIEKIIGNRKIILLEDNCESLGASFEGKKAGTFGLMGSFSTFYSHHISTMEGGLVVTDDEELYHILLCIRAHGWTRNLPKSNHVSNTRGDVPFHESFRFVLPGYNVRPLELSGAIGQEQLDKVHSIIATRRSNAAYFQERLGKHDWLQIQEELGESSWFGFSLLLKHGAPVSRDTIVKNLQDAGVEVRPVVAGNFTKNEALRWFDYEVFGDLKNANYVDQSGFFIGNHHYNLNSEIDYLARLCAEY